MPSEQEIVEAVESVCTRLAYKFRFGYHELEDMKQKAYILVIEAIDEGKWDQSRPLKNFIYVHVHNRFFNFKRKHYQRLAAPCEKCPLNAYKADEDKCLAFSLKEDCKWYRSWIHRNDRKKSLMHSVELTNAAHPSIDEDAALDKVDFLDWVEKLIPPNFRKTWELARSGERYNAINFKEMVQWIKDNINDGT